MIKLIIKHKWAVIVAILVGLIIAAPQMYFQINNKDAYQGIGLAGTDDEEVYLMRIQEARDGYYAISNSSWAEGKNLPYLFLPLSENITSLVGRILGLGLIKTVTLARFIFPFIAFLLIYTLVYQLTKIKAIALVASTTVLLSVDLVDPKAIWNLLIHQQTRTDFVFFSRLISPQVHLLFFFGFLLLFWFFLQKKKWIYGIGSGIVLGLSFYTYPFTFTFLFAFLGCLVLIFLFKKEWLNIRNIILIAVITLLVAIPYFYNLWQGMQHPLYQEIMLRHALQKTHIPNIGMLVVMLLVIFILFFSREEKERYVFCLGLVLAPLIVLNQQIITGIVMEPGHYHWFYHKPLAVIFIIIILFELIKKRFKSIIYLGLIGLVLLVNLYNAWVVQSSSYQRWEPVAIENQRYGPVFEWFNDNGQKDEVIVGDEISSCFIPIYTSLNSVSCEDGHYSLVADEEQVLERIFLTIRLNGIKENAKEYFYENRANLSARIYGAYYLKTFGGYGNISDQKLDFLIDKYKEFLSLSLEDILKKYQADYLIWDLIRHPEWQIEDYSFLEKVYQDKSFKVFKVL